MLKAGPLISSDRHSAMHFGILNVNKPVGVTSRDVVDCVERLTRPAKCGHAGTLDPLATGVLVICVGPATRLIQYVQRMPKRYSASFLLGRGSPTDDMEGEITLVEGAPEPTQAEVEAALPPFLGEIEQRPPDFSAVKVAGQRAYTLARRGKAVELAARMVTIHRLEIRRYAYPELELEIECGSGTYVRSIGRDLAAALDTSAVMSALMRTAIGGFRVEEAVGLDELTAENLSSHLQPALRSVADLPRVMLDDAQLQEIRHGRPIARPIDDDANLAANAEAEWAAVDATGQLVALLREKHIGQLWPAMNFGT